MEITRKFCDRCMAECTGKNVYRPSELALDTQFKDYQVNQVAGGTRQSKDTPDLCEDCFKELKKRLKEIWSQFMSFMDKES